LQDEEDAKRGLYNWFAQSRALLTLPRLLLGTVTAFAAPVLLLGAARGALVAATTLAVTLSSGYYGNAIIGGVVGDYLGATIQVGSGGQPAGPTRPRCTPATVHAAAALSSWRPPSQAL
jgi:cobalamin synthase